MKLVLLVLMMVAYPAFAGIDFLVDRDESEASSTPNSTYWVGDGVMWNTEGRKANYLKSLLVRVVHVEDYQGYLLLSHMVMGNKGYAHSKLLLDIGHGFIKVFHPASGRREVTDDEMRIAQDEMLNADDAAVAEALNKYVMTGWGYGIGHSLRLRYDVTKNDRSVGFVEHIRFVKRDGVPMILNSGTAGNDRGPIEAWKGKLKKLSGHPAPRRR